MSEYSAVESLPVSGAVVHQIVRASRGDIKHISLLIAAGISFDFRLHMVMSYNKTAGRFEPADIPVVSVNVCAGGLKVSKEEAVQSVSGRMLEVGFGRLIVGTVGIHQIGDILQNKRGTREDFFIRGVCPVAQPPIGIRPPACIIRGNNIAAGIVPKVSIGVPVIKGSRIVLIEIEQNGHSDSFDVGAADDVIGFVFCLIQSGHYNG